MAKMSPETRRSVKQRRLTHREQDFIDRRSLLLRRKSESGFFYRSMHTDTKGIWCKASLSLGRAQPIIRDYQAPCPWREVLRHCKVPYKYDDAGNDSSWQGIVLAGQKPKDRAVTCTSATLSAKEYWAFLEAACKHYGPRLLVKLHPCLNADDHETRHREIAAEHGAACGYFSHSVLDSCEWVLVYTSTCAVDAWMHGKNVVQWAPGYFSGTTALTYSPGEFRDPEDRLAEADQLLDFLIWRYCWHVDSKGWRDRWAPLFHNPVCLFPLPEELSYASWIRQAVKQKNETYIKVEEGPWLSR